MEIINNDTDLRKKVSTFSNDMLVQHLKDTELEIEKLIDRLVIQVGEERFNTQAEAIKKYQLYEGLYDEWMKRKQAFVREILSTSPGMRKLKDAGVIRDSQT